MIIVQVKEGENIEKALKKFKRKFERTKHRKRTAQPSGIRKAFCDQPQEDDQGCLRSAAPSGRAVNRASRHFVAIRSS